MHTGNHYKLKEFLLWTRRDSYWIFFLAVVPTSLYYFLDWKWLAIPWVPIAMIGTAAAFIVGFRNNATYSRLWEARQLWGSIVNSSRSWGIMVRDFVTNHQAKTPLPLDQLQQVHQQLIYRHMAWLTALRYQLREPRSWENMRKRYNREYQEKVYKVPEQEHRLEDILPRYLSPEEENYILAKKNRAAQIISLQSAQLRDLLQAGLIDNFRHMALEGVLKDFYNQQGGCERIKNFPYPRQFASINLFFVRLFIIMMPFGMLQEFGKLGGWLVWFSVPASLMVSWVFNAMEKVGESTENPFEGSANDVPISALSRTIEIDLREMLEEKDLPPALQPENNILL
ncbi:bestrophin family protein [Chitinophaga nivalis]|uniref:Multidrug transporter n=1 Tax=Chitinophaga nivalis TaxID=2991709 RepID=A0ABT3IJV6_9BACT|nr:bestrophin family ion channel [Chitinophaga nivalis]MCW3466219.1 hypothetical protein [Chitinophaga nivalis]MCW3484090.1 hypothetical protein [Chitinophaga nivalis]